MAVDFAVAGEARFTGFLKAGITLGGVLGLVFSAQGDNKDSVSCRAPIPTDVTLVRDFYLCKSAHKGRIDTYSCRDYRSANQQYRVFYKGGVAPKAVARVRYRNSGESLTYIELPESRSSICDVVPPTTVPRTAKFLGTGVCEDKHERNVPCSVFRAAPARQFNIVAYIVFYDREGNGPSLIDAQPVGSNHDALVAEMAFQIGTDLIDTACCYKQGLRYLTYAIKRFPQSRAYREVYRWYKWESEVTEQAPCLNVAGSR